jgi:hypothetical protein
VLALAGACGDEDPQLPEATLLLYARWGDDPPSTDAIGYEVEVLVNLSGREQTCSALPDLRITVNDADFPIAAGDCDAYLQVTAPAVRADVDTVVTLRSANGLMATATFPGLFPGFGGLQVVSPADGRVRMGETLALAIPPGWPVGDGRVTALVQWLDPAPSVPPFRSFVLATATADRTAVQLTVPMLTGRAQVILENLGGGDNVDAEVCTGFDRCRALPASDVLGPLAIEVLP